ncbi:RtcB family protein [Pseudomonas phage BRkr]|nr:RtcB family protein [Pseudomonas phage BRkr]
MTTQNYVMLNEQNEFPIKGWVKGVPVEADAKRQLKNIAGLPFIYKHLAVMPDVHLGTGATIGSVIATRGAIIPSAVGVDIGCGMACQLTDLTANDMTRGLQHLRYRIESRIPHGRTDNGGPNDRGAWSDFNLVYKKLEPELQVQVKKLEEELKLIVAKHPKLGKAANRAFNHAGTLGTGNHFVEICLDEQDRVWIMLHSGSRGIGNAIGRYFIEKAKEEMRLYHINLPDQDLAYLPEGTKYYNDYIEAVHWAQRYAALNRTIMMRATIEAVADYMGRPINTSLTAVNCHHNYVSFENHFGAKVSVTRKGAVRADEGMYGIIPGSMGAKSFIVKGKGNRESFCSCSHGAGRVMSRTQAAKTFTLEDHARDTAGIECRKDIDVIDETPKAYKNIEDVMAAQDDLIEIVHTLRQIVCVKG